jgi:hypothetical protein
MKRRIRVSSWRGLSRRSPCLSMGEQNREEKCNKYNAYIFYIVLHDYYLFNIVYPIELPAS